MSFLSLIGVLAVAALTSSIIGSAWYMPLFGKLWRKEMGIIDTQGGSKKQMYVGMGVQFITDMLSVFIVVLISMFSGFSPLVVAPVVWLGFIAPVMLGSVLYERRSWTLFAINAGYRLVALVAMAAILMLF